MSNDFLARGRAAALPVLILESDFIRAGTMLADVESLGLGGHILPSGSNPAESAPTRSYSLAILTVLTLKPDDLRAAAAIRRTMPDVPLLLLSEEKEPGAAPWPGCTVIRKKGALSRLREQVGEILGIVLTDDAGTTLKAI